MKRIDNFKSIIDKYQVIFFDAFGVIKTYQGLVPGVEKTFDARTGNNGYIGFSGINSFGCTSTNLLTRLMLLLFF